MDALKSLLFRYYGEDAAAYLTSLQELRILPPHYEKLNFHFLLDSRVPWTDEEIQLIGELVTNQFLVYPPHSTSTSPVAPSTQVPNLQSTSYLRNQLDAIVTPTDLFMWLLLLDPLTLSSAMTALQPLLQASVTHPWSSLSVSLRHQMLSRIMSSSQALLLEIRDRLSQLLESHTQPYPPPSQLLEPQPQPYPPSPSQLLEPHPQPYPPPSSQGHPQPYPPPSSQGHPQPYPPPPSQLLEPHPQPYPPPSSQGHPHPYPPPPSQRNPQPYPTPPSLSLGFYPYHYYLPQNSPRVLPGTSRLRYSPTMKLTATAHYYSAGGDLSKAISTLHQVPGYERVTKTMLSRWVKSDPLEEKAKGGRPYSAAFEAAVVAEVRTLPTITYEGVRTAGISVRNRSEHFQTDPLTKDLKFSDKWVRGLLRRAELTTTNTHQSSYSTDSDCEST